MSNLANLFEKILLFERNKEHREDDHRFGFKDESSCSHDIAVLNYSLNIRFH